MFARALSIFAVMALTLASNSLSGASYIFLTRLRYASMGAFSLLRSAMQVRPILMVS